MKSNFASACLGILLAVCAGTAAASNITYAYRGIDVGLFGDYQVGYNSQLSTPVSNNLPAFDNVQAGNGTYSHLSVSFTVSDYVAGSDIAFQIAADGGYGGAAYVDGNLAQTRNYDIWWSYDWNNVDQLLLVTLNDVTAGLHVLDFYWAEGCCNGFQSARFNINDGNWLGLSVNNIDSQIPEPGSLALLGLGLSAAFFARRKNV
jgi:hypothetical protein